MDKMHEKLKVLDEAAVADEAFAQELSAAMKARDFNEFARVAATKGVTITEEDLSTYKVDGRELDDAELHAVAGGHSFEEFIDDALSGVGCVAFVFISLL